MTQTEYDTLYARYGDAFVERVRRELATGRRTDAEDIAQEAWADVWRDADKPADEGGWDRQYHLTTYLRFKARFRILEANRAAARADLPDDELDRVASPGGIDEGLEVRARAAIHAELLRVALRCGGHPHEVLAFSLAKLVHGSTGSRGAAAAVAETYGPHWLSLVAREFAQRYRRVDSAWPGLGEATDQAMLPVMARMEVSGKELLSRDALTRRFYLHLEATPVGDNPLRAYFLANPPPLTVAQWSDKVRKALLETISAPNTRCPKCRCLPVGGCSVQDGDGASPLAHISELDLGALAVGSLRGSARQRAVEHLANCELCSLRLQAWGRMVADPEGVLDEWVGAAGTAGLAWAIADLLGEHPGLATLAEALRSGLAPLSRLATASLGRAMPWPRADAGLRGDGAVACLASMPPDAPAEFEIPALARAAPEPMGAAFLLDLVGDSRAPREPMAELTPATTDASSPPPHEVRVYEEAGVVVVTLSETPGDGSGSAFSIVALVPSAGADPQLTWLPLHPDAESGGYRAVFTEVAEGDFEVWIA